VPEAGGTRPGAFYHGLEYGTVGVYLMDLRSERQATEEQIQVYSDQQFAALEGFLHGCADKHVVLIVLSVPLLHVPDWLAKVGIKFGSRDGDLEDRWSNPKAHRSRNRLLLLIREHQRRHPAQRVVILGGDVHVGLAARLEWGEGIRDSYELVSSAVSNVSAFNLRRIVDPLPDLETEVGEDGDGEFVFKGSLLRAKGAADSPGEPASSNPCGELNCGLVEVERVSSSESTVRLLLLGPGDDDSKGPSTVFDSGPL
jgi:alkaline phosphatase D